MRGTYIIWFLAAALFLPTTAWAKGNCPSNLIPMYELEKRSPAEMLGQKSLTDEQSRKLNQQSEAAVDLGWRYFLRDSDPSTAMKRFNQAWLLDRENANAFHGMAVMSLVLKEDTAFSACPFSEAQAEALFQKSLAGKETPPGAYADYGRFLVIQKRYSEAIPPLKTAIEKNPDLAQAILHLSGAYEGIGDHAQACTWAKKAMAVMKELPSDLADEVCAKAE